MELQEYLEQKKNIQRNLLDFIENDDNTEEHYQNFIKLIQNQKISKDRQELKSLLYLISKISNNHHRTPSLFTKMEQIIKHLENQIKQALSNHEIFNIFKNNKKILLFLIEQQIIKVDKSISTTLILPKYEKRDYPPFFLTDIKKTVHNQRVQKLIKNTPEDIDERRKICENDSPLCEIIRKDSVADFTSFISQKNLNLSIKVKHSILETNPLLLKKDPTLIEYAAFYGSIQIIKYLQKNNIELPKSLWIYSIHSQNIELIHFLEKNNVQPEDGTYENCMIEAIKCHHIEIANYIRDNLIQKEEDKNGGEPKINRKMREHFYSSAIRYYNYAYFDSYFKNNLCFVRFCQYDYYKIVELILKNYEMNPNARIGKDSFKYCTQLTEVEIPSNIQSIENSAFKGCSSLKKVTFSSSLTSIGDFAFEQCTSLEEITIPSSVKQLGKVVFQGCTSLKKVTFEFPSTLTTIHNSDFALCSSLKEIKFPSSLTVIEKNAFTSCSSLKEIYFPPSVVEIGEGAFGNCTSLKKASFSNKSALSVINDGAFKDCTALTKIKLPPSITKVGDKVFNNCTSLVQILIPSTLNSFSEEGLPANAKIDRI